jgi:hypothetical protein
MAIKSKNITRTESSTLEGNATGTLDSDQSPVELGFIIDKSSSMEHLQRPLIEAFNTLLAEQQAPGVNASLSLFSDDVAVVADHLPVGMLAKLNQSSYRPQGQTALLDGIGSMIFMMDRAATPDRKLIVIFTDGCENCSMNFDLESVTYQIKACQDKGWQFIFVTPYLGIGYAEMLGIPRDHIVDFTASGEGLRSIMDRLSKTVKAYRIGDVNYTSFLLEDKKS